MDIHKEINFFTIAERFQLILQNHRVPFYENGYPNLTNFHYLESIPNGFEMWPYSKRNQCADPQNTILNFFENDDLLYGYLNTIDKVVNNLTIYYAVTGFDISPCINYPPAIQNAALLINALTNGIFLVNHIRVIPSFRIGGINTVSALRTYPRGICYAFGTLGCARGLASLGHYITTTKLMLQEPSQLLVYGNLQPDDAALFKQWNVPTVAFSDYQRKTRMKSKMKGGLNV